MALRVTVIPLMCMASILEKSVISLCVGLYVIYTALDLRSSVYKSQRPPPRDITYTYHIVQGSYRNLPQENNGIQGHTCMPLGKHYLMCMQGSLL